MVAPFLVGCIHLFGTLEAEAQKEFLYETQCSVLREAKRDCRAGRSVGARNAYLVGAHTKINHGCFRKITEVVNIRKKYNTNIVGLKYHHFMA